MFLFRKKKKIQVLTIHGFGKKLHREFEPLQHYLEQNGCEVHLFDIYNVQNEKDDDYKQWIKRCEKHIKNVLEKDSEIILIGFSMGGVIASYLASIYPIKKLILIAPAFQYLDLQKITHHSLSALKNLGKKEKQAPTNMQTRAFMSIVDQYKDSIYHIDCPTLILHGTKDEVIPFESSRKVYKHMHCPKKLVLIEGGQHRMLYDKKGYETLCFILIQAMITKDLNDSPSL